MKKLEYQVSFATPAFLGNAEQQAQWRTPPFKALLRQWWRVAYAAENNFQVDVAAMRREEGLLFGNAWLSHREGNRDVTDHSKSLVRIRLDRWDAGTLHSWNGFEQGTVHHPETERTGYKVGPHAYLGFGPLDGRGGTKLSKANVAIQAGETAVLSIAVPDKHAQRIQRTLMLMDRYGTLGGRSRNGWGSFSLLPQEGTPALGGEVPVRAFDEALALDWPHAIGQNNGGMLEWQTGPHADWKALMKTLAVIKIGLRTQFVFPNAAPPHPQPLPRHWLSYPITRHTTHAFDRNARLPNSLRFKVRNTSDGKLVGVIFHVPCLPPSCFNPQKPAIVRTWQSVHELLNELTNPANARGYSSIQDSNRRAALKPGLDSVTLKRITE